MARPALAALVLLTAAARPPPTHRPPLPVVFWHGMGDSCCAPHSLGGLAADVEAALNVPVVSIDSGGGRGAALDVASGFIGSVDAQVAAACAALAADARLAGGFNAVGFSQGGLFLRALVQRCPRLPVRTLVTLGSPHRGVAAPPTCPPPTPSGARSLCAAVEAALAAAAYAPGVKDVVVQASYFKDPARLDMYRAAHTLIADINNEGPVKNATYASSLTSLRRLVAFRFQDDVTVVPRDSAWFADVGEDGGVVEVKQTELWRGDWVGLRALAADGRLTLATAPGGHMQIGRAWFREEVVDKYLSARAGEVI